MRLIDADALLERAVPHGWSTPLWVSDIMIEDAPTIDAVEVVRCKDCKHNKGSCCDYSAVYVRPHGYCQWGERREDGHN